MLGGLHTHALVLGTFFFLIVFLLENQYKLTEHKNFNKFFIIYNIGLISLLVMMIIRGCVEVLTSDISPMWDGAISGLAGISHIMMTAAFVRFFLILFKKVDEIEKPIQ